VSDCRLIVCWSAGGQDIPWLEPLAENLPSLLRITTGDSDEGARIYDFGSWIERNRDLPASLLCNYFMSESAVPQLHMPSCPPDQCVLPFLNTISKAFSWIVLTGPVDLSPGMIAWLENAGTLFWDVSSDTYPRFQTVREELANQHFPYSFSKIIWSGEDIPADVQALQQMPPTTGKEFHEAIASLQKSLETVPIMSPTKKSCVDSKNLEEFKERLQPQILEQLKGTGNSSVQTREKAEATLTACLAGDPSIAGDRQTREKIYQKVLEDVLGLGELEPLLKDPTVSEIMVNSREKVFVERRGRLEFTDVHFPSDAQIRTLIDRIIAPIGRRVDESMPLCDARLADGSRVNIVIPPLALDGPSITIRKFSENKLGFPQLISFGSLNEEMTGYLDRTIKEKKNIVVSGGTGSGKTTLLNALAGLIPDDERIVTIEDAAELRLGKPHVVRLESRPPNAEGQGAIPIRRLVINALRMRPDRIVVGECRGGEALDMLQAMNTGHDGSLTTVHANSPRDALGRIETLVLMAGIDLPVRVVREQIRSAVHVIVQQARLGDGSRKIISITELTGMEEDRLTTQELFRFRKTGQDADERYLGVFESTGLRSWHLKGNT
jgi:pilus assembly protein CpaF